MDKERIEQLTDLYIAALKQLGVHTIIMGIGAGSGSALVISNGEMFNAAALLRGVNNQLLQQVPKEHLQEFARIMGAKVVTSREEFERLTGEDPEVFEMSSSSYRSKTIH